MDHPKKLITTNECRVVKYREGGGTSMPWTWEECVHCGAVRGEPCQITESRITQIATSQAHGNYIREKNYGDVEHDIAPVVRELVRQERIRQDQPVHEETSALPWFMYGLAVGCLCLIVTKVIQYFI